MQHKVLIFDFFGVVCSEIAPFWFEEHLPENAKELKHQYLRPADRGEVSQEELFNQLSNLSAVPAEEIEQDWNERAIFNTDLLSFIKELKGEYRLGLLSNSMAPLFHTLAEEAHVADLFEQIAVSSEIGHAKPEPEAFQAILEKLNVLPEEALMIDDNQVNLDGAKAIGMPGYLFTSVSGLRAALGR